MKVCNATYNYYGEIINLLYLSTNDDAFLEIHNNRDALFPCKLAERFTYTLILNQLTRLCKPRLTDQQPMPSERPACIVVPLTLTDNILSLSLMLIGNVTRKRQRVGSLRQPAMTEENRCEAAPNSAEAETRRSV